jgi:hypothetical protein
MAIEELGGRVSKLEQDVSDLKVDAAKIATSLDAMKERQEERHQYLVKGIDQIEESLKVIVPAHSHSDKSAPSKWVRDILTPQTVTIVLAILASALGAPMVAQSLIGTQTVAPTQVQSQPLIKAAPEVAPVEEKEEAKEEAAPDLPQ